MTIPRGDIPVTDGPVLAIIKPFGCFKFKITPSLGLACPQQRFAPHLIPSYPVKRFFLNILLVIVVDIKMACGLTVSIMFTDQPVVCQVLEGFPVTVFELPAIGVGGRIIFDMFYHPSPFNQQGLKSFFGELLRYPT